MQYILLYEFKLNKITRRTECELEIKSADWRPRDEVHGSLRIAYVSIVYHHRSRLKSRINAALKSM